MSQPHLVVLYGTETTNTEDIAKIIVWEGCRRRAIVEARPLDCEPFENLTGGSDAVVIFVISTMGQGEPPLNLMPFWKKLMRKNLSSDSMVNLNCAVIGLGDSSYAKYNYVGKKLYKRLLQLGADLVLDVCLGDDQHDYGYWGAVDPFLALLWDHMTKKYCLPRFTFASDFLPPATFTFTSVSEADGDFSTQNGNEFEPITVISNTRVTPANHFQQTRLIKLTSGSLTYAPGDVVAIRPENSESDVQDLLKLMDLKENETFCSRMREDDRKSVTAFSHRNLVGNHTLGQMLRRHLDLHAVPKRSFFHLLWKFSSDEVEKKKLQEFSTIEGQEDLDEYCFKPKRMIIEVFRDFPNTTSRIPLQYLPDLLPAIRPREFSIASSPNCHPGKIHILVVVVEYKTRLKELRTGFCSNFLANCNPGDRIEASINRGSFVLVPVKPLIMIGPGSGVAPFRGIIQDRIGNGIKENILFFGCRNKSADFYFEHDWTQYTQSNSLKLFTAFSRDQIEKVYVQHQMYAQKDVVLELILKRDAVILIAGSSNQMPTSVRQELVRIIDESSGNGENFVSQLEKTRRLQYECWD